MAQHRQSVGKGRDSLYTVVYGTATVRVKAMLSESSMCKLLLIYRGALTLVRICYMPLRLHFNGKNTPDLDKYAVHLESFFLHLHEIITSYKVLQRPLGSSYTEIYR